MKIIHEFVSQKISWYENWHRRKYAGTFHWALLVGIAIVTGSFLLTQIRTSYALAAFFIEIYPGTSIQSVVDANPPGTEFIIKSGVHRLQSVVPKDGDIFTGEIGSVMSGATVLTTFTTEGAAWVVSGQTQEGQIHTGAPCFVGYPRCGYPEDVFFDNIPLKAVDSLAAGSPGNFFFDYPNDKIYLWDNPAGHTVETGVARLAFEGCAYNGNVGCANNVTIQGLTIEKYAIPPQMGAIGDQWGSGTNWLIKNNEIRLNHGGGIRVGNAWRVLNNNIHDNGQEGAGGGGTDIVFENNEINHNGYYSGVDWGWEGGAFKFVNTNRLIVRNNNSHDNKGPGMWTDIDNINTLFEGNTVVSNLGPGIFHEVSYAAIIRNNIVKNNAELTDQGWLWDGQIEISTSQNVEVYNNTVEINSNSFGNGITILQQNRTGNSCTYGPCKSANNYVHNNMITVTGTANHSATGVVQDYSGLGDVLAANNRFDSNSYLVPNLSGSHWSWNNFEDWTAWKASGQDVHGCASTTNTCPVPFIPTVNFSASPASIPSGSSSVLTWTTTNATTVSISPGIGTVGPSGTTTVTPTTTTIYTITATNPFTSSTATTTVTVIPPVDTTPPTTAITSPTSGATLKGTVTVSATATDNVGVTKVELYVGSVLKGTDTTSPYSFSLDTTALTNGSVTLQTKAYDAAGNVGRSANVSVTISNKGHINLSPTSLSFTAIKGAPAPATKTVTLRNTGTATLPWSVSDNQSWCHVSPASGSLLKDASAPLIVSVDALSSTGTFSCTVSVASTSADNSPQTIAVTYTVTPDTTSPTVSITAPSSGSIVAKKSTINITANSADNIGVTKVLFYVGSTLICTDTATPYTCSWNVGNSAGTYTLQAKSYDAAGNIGTSSNVIVIVK